MEHNLSCHLGGRETCVSVLLHAIKHHFYRIIILVALLFQIIKLHFYRVIILVALLFQV